MLAKYLARKSWCLKAILKCVLKKRKTQGNKKKVCMAKCCCPIKVEDVKMLIVLFRSFPWQAKSLQSYLTLCDPMDCSPSRSSVHGILQARILEWVAMPSFRGSSQPRDQIHIFYVSCIGRVFVFCFLPLAPPRKSI